MFCVVRCNAEQEVVKYHAAASESCFGSLIGVLAFQCSTNLYHTSRALSSGLTDNSHHAILAQCRGGVAQLGERNTGSVEVRSSILLSSTKQRKERLPCGKRSFSLA